MALKRNERNNIFNDKTLEIGNEILFGFSDSNIYFWELFEKHIYFFIKSNTFSNPKMVYPRYYRQAFYTILYKKKN